MSKQTAVIDSDHATDGQTNAHIRVVAGGRLIQHGQVNGDIVVESGGMLDQHGQVNGSIHAHADGVVRLWGQVNGSLHADEGADFRIAEGVMLVSGSNARYLAASGTWQSIPHGQSFSTRVGATTWRLTPSGRIAPA